MIRTLPLAQWLSSLRPDDTPVAWHGDRAWTLGELRYDVATLQSALKTWQGQRWALCFDNSYLFIVALLATLHAGKTPVMLGHSRVSLLEQQKHLFDGLLSDTELNITSPTAVVVSAHRVSDVPLTFADISEAAHIELFTSGSTGQPRRVVKPIACLDREAELLAQRFGKRLAGCRIVASVVPQHLYGLTFRIFLPMALSLPLSATMIYYAEQLAAIAPGHRYAFISSPAFLKRLDHQLAPPPVDLIISAGGKLPWRDVEHAFHWLGVWPDEIYGSTETGILAWRHRQRDACGWVPFPGVTLHEHHGVFHAISPLIPEPQGIELDDMLSFDEQGMFTIGARRGRVVKIEEKRISLEEVEQRVLALEGIIDAAALPVYRNGRQGIGVLLVLDEKTRCTWQQHNGKAVELSWRRALIPWLEPVAIPRYWRILDEIPVNSMNKRVVTQLEEFFHETS
ncbi:AMP-dependent synthetase [Siccibacter turicensis]|uniref:AMP-dependent synthetase n=1 Tax=Siccibacter turicensis TaxID=357233 RepID=UPI003F5587ED